jgi:hypothetical protein
MSGISERVASIRARRAEKEAERTREIETRRLEERLKKRKALQEEEEKKQKEEKERMSMYSAVGVGELLNELNVSELKGKGKIRVRHFRHTYRSYYSEAHGNPYDRSYTEHTKDYGQAEIVAELKWPCHSERDRINTLLVHINNSRFLISGERLFAEAKTCIDGQVHDERRFAQGGIPFLDDKGKKKEIAELKEEFIENLADYFVWLNDK